MKKIITASLFLLLFAVARATECSYSIFQEEKINLAFCQNHGRGKETALLFQARTKAINEYIKDKIAKGELQDKKFEITILDPVLSSTHLELTQGKNSYFVIHTGMEYPTLQQLMAFVDYFAKPDWKSFSEGFHINNEETDEEWEKRTGAVMRRINSIRNSNKDMPAVHQIFAIWENDGVSVEYAGDSLRFSIGGTVFPLQVLFPLPVKIQDRYLFFQNDSIVVLQDTKIIQTFNIEKAPLDEDIRVVTHQKWVNIIFDGDKDDWAYSYSYDKNTLHVNPRWKYFRKDN